MRGQRVSAGGPWFCLSHLPALQSPRGSLLVSGPDGQAVQDTDLKTQWPSLFLSWGPGPDPTQISVSLASPASIHELGRKPALLSLPPVSSVASQQSAWATAQTCPPICASLSPPSSPTLGTSRGLLQSSTKQAKRQQLRISSGFTEVVLISPIT